MEYVLIESKKEASLNKVDVTGVNSIFTKIKKYPYEFEIDGELKLASIDGVKIANNAGIIEITENGEYDNNYELGFNASKAIFNKKTESFSANNVNGHEFDFGYVPRFILIVASQKVGQAWIYWSEDSCKTFYEKLTQEKVVDGSKYFQTTSKGKKLVNWSNEYHYTFDIWTIR